MTIHAVIMTATGEVINIIEWDGVASYAPPDGCELRETAENTAIGGTWDGSKFILPAKVGPSRLDVLMSEGPATEVYNEETTVMDDRPADDIAADKAELLGLLQTKLADTGDLTWEEMNKMLALERET